TSITLPFTGVTPLKRTFNMLFAGLGYMLSMIPRNSVFKLTGFENRFPFPAASCATLGATAAVTFPLSLLGVISALYSVGLMATKFETVPFTTRMSESVKPDTGSLKVIVRVKGPTALLLLAVML